jgi:hypothetical protein
VEITPPAGTPMAGYYFVREADGVHDPLYAKAIVLEVGESRAALVALDLISTTRDLVEEARAEVERRTGIPGSNVMISATHAHTGPVIGGGSSREADFGGRSEAALAYRKVLPGKIAEAVGAAWGTLTPARALVARGEEKSIAFNRRFHMKDGSVGWNPGKGNPAIVKPAGPIDPDVPVVYFEGVEGSRRPLATYVNYAVHLDNIGGPSISADLPGVLARLLGEYKGKEMVTVWTAGCCGDINHVNVKWPEPQKGFENASRMGIILAGEVLRRWPELSEVGAGRLRVKSRLVSLPAPEVTEEEVAKAREILARRREGTKPQPTFLETVGAYKALDVAAREGKPREVEVQVIALGDDLAWVSLPGEIFVDLGLAIKQDSPFRHTIIAELANGSIGYVPSRRAYGQGNYEVVSARCAEGSGELLVDAAIALLKELSR